VALALTPRIQVGVLNFTGTVHETIGACELSVATALNKVFVDFYLYFNLQIFYLFVEFIEEN
jgi:hypothetical protein